MAAVTEPAQVFASGLRQHATDILNICLCVAFIVGYAVVGWTLAFGPASFHQSNSMRIVAGLGVPWTVWGAIYVTAAMLLTNRWTRIGGYFLGAGLCGFYLASYLISIRHGHPGSAPGLFAGYAAVLSQVSGLVRSLIAAEWRHD